LLEVFIARQKLQPVLHRVLGDNQIRDANLINPIPKTGNLCLNDVIPIHLDGMFLDFLENASQPPLSTEVKWWKEFRENQIVNDD